MGTSRRAEPPTHPVILSNAVPGLALEGSAHIRTTHEGPRRRGGAPRAPSRLHARGVATGVRAAVSPLVVTGAAPAAARAESTIALMTSNGCEPMTMRPSITNDGVDRIAAVSAAFA